MVNKAILLMGPTAVGKTEVALRIAQKFSAEIISVDSALIYRDLNIGSAKPSLDELAAVPHHLIDIISPLENYSVAEFLAAANQQIVAINQRGNLPLLVGGTMMYYNALINGISSLPSADPELRAELAQRFALVGNAGLYTQLCQLDPVAAARINPNDSQRINRALEVCLLTGRPLSAVQLESHQPGLVNCDHLALTILPTARNLLHARINQRFVNMLEQGFIEEVRDLRLKYPDLTAAHNSMRSVGYRQVWDYLEGDYSRDELLALGQAATRQLAKRQITWLRSLPAKIVDDPQLDLAHIEQQLTEAIQCFV